MTEQAQRVRLTIAYDGTEFSGWAAQPNLRTVQGVLEDALAMVLRTDRIPITVAGRTDAGVHATGQVAHCDIDPGVLEHLADGAGSIAGRVNRLLGSDSDVVVIASEPVSSDFDARFSAVWRRYQYQIADATTTPNPLCRHSVVTIPGQLDLASVQAFSSNLLGLGDFATYCKPRPEATTIRDLQVFDWQRDDAGVITAELRADAFCHSMVRALIGAAVAVGTGRMSLEHAMELRDARERSSEFVVMPPGGLTLVEVGYPDQTQWLERAERIRAKRSPEELGESVAE